MYENKTFEAIMEEMLDNVPNDVDKREGSVIYDALAPVAIELAQVYIDMDMLIEETFADSASYYYLAKRAAERGIFAEEATPAVLKITVKAESEDMKIELGTEFNIGELNYTVTNSLGEGQYLLTCDTAGTEGNNTTDEVIPMEYIEGLEAITKCEVYVSGKDNEDEEHLRERYIESFGAFAFGGNKADYKEKIKSIPGVGGCKVFSAQDLNLPAGNVECYITDNNYGSANSALVSEVQNLIDPEQNGTGNGWAPCGHIVKIRSVAAEAISVQANFEFEDGVTWSELKDQMMERVNCYFSSLAKKWDDGAIVVRGSEIINILLDIDGVKNVEDVQIYTTADFGANAHFNVTIGERSIPILLNIMMRGQSNG